MQKIAGFIVGWLKVHWSEVLVWLVLLALAVLLGWLFWRRFGATIISRGVELWEKIIRVPEVPKNSLTEIWRTFKKGIPPRLRKGIRNYPVFVVLGDHRSGKTSIVKSGINPDLQSLRFHKGVGNDSLMQAYLGSNEVVLELSPNFLYSTSQDHADALLALWTSLPHGTTVVLTLDVRGLLGQDVEQQSRIINALVAKLAAFTESNDKSVPIRIVLTHMDGVRGFQTFYAFAANSGLDIHVELQKGEVVPSFAKGLDHYLNYTSNLLVNLSSDDFLECIKFLASARQILSTLETYLFEAVSRSELQSFELNSVCLLSDAIPELRFSLRTNDPFRNSGPPVTFIGSLAPKHLRNTKYIGAILLVFSIFHYSTERWAIEGTAELLQRIPSMSPEQLEASSVRTLKAFEALHSGVEQTGILSLLHLTQHFYPTRIELVGRELAKAIRTYYLIPGLRLAQVQPHIYPMTIRWLALLHANTKNQIGSHFTNPEIVTGIPIPQEIILAYLVWNTDPADHDLLGLQDTDYGTRAGSSVDKPSLDHLEEAMQFAFSDAYISEQELVDIQSSARTVEAVIENSRNYPLLDEEVLWLTKNGHVSSATKALWAATPTEGMLQSPGLKDTVSMIIDSKLSSEDQPQDFIQLLEIIKKKIAQSKEIEAKNSLGTVSGSIEGHFYSFDSNEWLALIHKSQIKLILDNFYRRHYSNDGWIFFQPQAQPYRIPLGISTDTTGVLVNNAHVDSRLTRDSYEQKIKPAITMLSTLMVDLPLGNEEKQILIDFFVQNLSTYAGNYADAYWGFFKNMALKINSPEQLQLYLKELQRPGSAFTQNLLRIKENVILDIPPNPNFQPVRDRLADFQFMQKLLQDQAGTYPQLERYILISGQLLEQMSIDGPPLPTPAPDKLNPEMGLKSILTPMGRVSYDMLLGNPTSLLRQVEIYLREMNIPASWQAPFLYPFHRAREFGRQDINHSIQTQWRQLWDTQVMPLAGKFPFESQRSGVIEDANPEYIHAVFHPTTGSFWNTIRNSFGALFNIVDGRWTPKPEVVSNFHLPEDMKTKLDAAADLTLALWDKNGADQPINIKARPDLLPEITAMNEDGDEIPLPSLTFLRTGSTSVLGFNQRKAWQDFNYEWWMKGIVSVGLEFLSPKEKIKKYASVDVDESRWSFYRLLLQAERGPKNQYAWILTHPEHPERKLKVSFAFKKDPFELFTSITRR